jgi:hypothetical protein
MAPPVLPQSPNPLDDRAEEVVALAQAEDVAVADRAVQIVERMLADYFPDQAAQVSRAYFDADDQGLSARPDGDGSATGSIGVGPYYVAHTTEHGLARRVLQLGHELQHIGQYRSGMVGDQHKHEREFLAFLWESSTPELPGTGRMPHATRVALIDAALENYLCMPDDRQQAHAGDREDLVALRQSEEALSGNEPTPIPSSGSC